MEILLTIFPKKGSKNNLKPKILQIDQRETYASDQKTINIRKYYNIQGYIPKSKRSIQQAVS